MLEYILEILQNNQVITSILKPTPKKPKIYLLSTSDTGDCIVYTWELIGADGIIKEYRLKIVAITNDYDIGQQLLNAINNELVTVGDITKHFKILECNQNGGGLMDNFETNKIHATRYYYIKSKY